MRSKISRRDFIKIFGYSGLALGTSLLLGGCENPIPRRVRRNIASLAPDDPIIEIYKDAVNAMKNLPASDPRSWTRQAQIHLDHCPHGNWFFLPWHRAYLSYFERICRELTGEEDFALPYWNWSTNRQVPAPFWGNSSNPLFNSTRTISQSDQAATEFVGQDVLTSIMNETDFFTFASGSATMQRTFSSYGRLEGTPHNYIHGFIGGNMGDFMSPLDPIFWLHHNMIECCWVEWNIGRRNPNTNDRQWIDFIFANNFFDETGASVDISVLDTLIMPIFYEFEDSFKGGPAPTLVAPLSEEALRTFLETGANVDIEVVDQFQLQRGFEVGVEQPLNESIEVEAEAIRTVFEATEDLRLMLTVGGVTPPSSEDFFVRVFVNLPEATAATPIDDPHYAGSFAFFSDARHAHDDSMPKPGYLVDLTNTVAELAAAGAMVDINQLDIQLVTVPLANRALELESFQLESLELTINRLPNLGQE